MKNVTKKLLKAVETVGGEVPKTGWNNFSKYKYITESDINKVILPALLQQGLLLTTSLESVVESPSTSENKNRFATVNLIHNIIDTESGETITLKSAGTAADTLDKAIYKAYTGSCKYFMMKLFLISGDDSDPENDSDTKPAISHGTSTTKTENKPQLNTPIPKTTKSPIIQPSTKDLEEPDFF